MPGQSSDRRLAAGFAISVVLCIVAMMATVAPNDAFPVATTFDGIPRLILYLAAGIALAATARGRRQQDAPGQPDGSHGGEDRWLTTWLGLAVLVAVVNAVRLDRDISALGAGYVWLLSLAFVIVALIPSFMSAARGAASLRWRNRWSLTLAVILLVAFVARFFALASVPVNVQADEGDRAASALDVLDGIAPTSWFESGWFYVNMVYFRLLALFFDIFGVGVVQGRLLNALAGFVIVCAVAWIGFRHFDRRVGLVATALAAVSPLALQFSRTIAESGVGAALFALSLAGFLEGGRTGRTWGYGVAGLAGGLSLYTYSSARSWPIAAVATIVVLLLFKKGSRRGILRGAAVAAVAALVAVLPFAAHIRGHPDELELRFQQTSVLSAENRGRLVYIRPDMRLGEVMALQFERSLGLFDRYEDESQFLPSGKPIFPKILAVLTLLGIFYASARGFRDPRLAILAVWFWIGLSGVILTVETPAAQRAAVLVVTLPLLAAIALMELASRVAPTLRYARARWVRPELAQASDSGSGHVTSIVDACVAATVLVLMVLQGLAYFVDYRSRTGPWSSTTIESLQVAELGADGPVYALESSQHMVTSGWVRFIARGAHTGSIPNPGSQLPVIAPDEPYADLPWRQRVPVPAKNEIMSFILYGTEQLPYLTLLRDLYGRGEVRPLRDGRTVFRVPPEAPTRWLGVVVHADGQRLGVTDGFGQIPTSATLPARLSWTSGIRVARPGLHRLELRAPVGSTLLLDGVFVAAGGGVQSVVRTVRVPSGLHLVELSADVSSHKDTVELRWSGSLSPTGRNPAARPFVPAQTYPAMTAPWGLLTEIRNGNGGGVANATPSQTWPTLTTTLAAGFVNIPDPLPNPAMVDWRGFLLVPRAGSYRMAFQSDGALTVTLDGRELSSAAVAQALGKGIRLTRGRHSVLITLRPKSTQPTFARWQWIPPRADGRPDPLGAWLIVPPGVLRPADPVQVVATVR